MPRTPTDSAPEIPRRILLVANPTSGRGRGQRWLERAAERLRARGGLEVETRLTRQRGEAEAWGREHRGYDELWAFGGDGTLNELCQGLAGSGTPLAVFPTGTGNVIARELGIRRHFEHAYQVALEGERRVIDLGRANGRRFLFVLSAGFDARVVEHVSTRRQHSMHRWQYLPALLACRALAEPRFHVTVDGQPAGAACWVALLNSRRYAGGFSLCPPARLDGGQLQLMLLRDPVGPRLWRVLTKAGRGRLADLPDCDVRGVRKVRIEAAPCAELDGDPFPPGDLEVEVEPGALRVKAPPRRSR